MKKCLLICICCVASHIICGAQIVPPTVDSMSAEEYSGWMTQYYEEHLNLNDWQHVQVYEIILGEKKKLADQITNGTPGDKPKMMKRYYHSLESKLGNVLTADQYHLYQHMNTVKIKTVELQ